jgi:superfamily II DNA or RNA helicase
LRFADANSLLDCSWYEFERLVYRLLQHAGWHELSFTSRSNDKGADIIGVPPTGRDAVIIQCKHTGSTSISKEGVEDLRRACDYYGLNRGIIATNAKLSSVAKNRLDELSGYYKLRILDFAQISSQVEKLAPESRNKKVPRDYQEVAIEKALEAFSNGRRAGMIVFATGLGKSMVLAELAAHFSENRQRAVLVLADRVPLIEQLEASMWPQLRPETRTRLWDGDRKPRAFDGITIATQQSVHALLKLGGELPSFGLVLIDECHHAASASYRELLALLKYDHLFGVTATPWRGDEQRVSDIFGEVTAEMGLVEGIKKGFLAGVDYTMFCDNVDWDSVKKNTEQRLTIADLNSRLFLPARDEDLCGAVIQEWNNSGQPMTLTFCRSIRHAERLAELFSAMGIPSRAIHSENMGRADQARLIMQFRAKSFSNLVSVDVLNEGVDVPDVGMVVFARVTHSRRIFVQQLGRGLRLTAHKDKVRVLDFVADIRRLAEGVRWNNEDRALSRVIEHYRGKGASSIHFSRYAQGNFVDQYLADIADLSETDKVSLDFLLR